MPRKAKAKAKPKGNQKKKGNSPSKSNKQQSKQTTSNTTTTQSQTTNATTTPATNNNNQSQTTSVPSTTANGTTTAATNGTVANGSTTNGTTNHTPAQPDTSNGSTSKQEPSSSDEKKNGSNEQLSAAELLVKRNPRRWKVDKDKSHPFWDDQPVPAMKDKIDDQINEAIENKTLDQVRKDPYLLPKDFEWCNMDLTNDTELTEFYNLLYNHYVEDDDNMFRFNYSKEFLQWALLVPDYIQEWHLGVRTKPKPPKPGPDGKIPENKLTAKKKGKLCACITAIPALVNIKGKQVQMVEINFLCVYKTLRSKRLAPVLIKEITRRVNCRNIWQAVYTAGVVIPKPVASNRYWHRSLNPKKLIDIGFSCMRQRMTMPRLLRLYRVEKETKTKGLRKMEEKDVEQCWVLLNEYLKKFALKIKFSKEEVKHLLLPRDNVVYTYVVAEKQVEGSGSGKGNKGGGSDGKENNENENEGGSDEKEGVNDEVITDFFSYYNLSSTVINNPKYDNMKAGYSYYNVTTKTPLIDLISDALVLAKSQGFDVFNALDVMENSSFLKDLKFGIGDGRLQYYMYNWKCAELQPNDVGIVLL